MNQSIGFAPVAALMFAAGVGVPIVAALNAGLGRDLDSPTGATWALFAVGFAISGVIALSVGLPPRAAYLAARPYQYGAVIFMVIYILSITWSAPRIGLGNAIFFVLVGQIAAASAIDHFGLLGAAPSAFTPKRALGVVIMAIGLYFARKPG